MLASLPTSKNHMSAGNVAGNETGNLEADLGFCDGQQQAQ